MIFLSNRFIKQSK